MQSGMETNRFLISACGREFHIAHACKPIWLVLQMYVDMHFLYGFSVSNFLRAVAKYHLRYSLLRKPNHGVFVATHQRFRETGSFGKVYEIDEARCSVTVEEYIVDRMEEDSNVI